MNSVAAVLTPRKSPLQSRSAATIDALHAAAIHILTSEGLGRCTTTRVAERAGASVGSLYQYYPNRDALLAAVLGKHLNEVAAAVETACVEARGKSVEVMAATLVSAFLAAKLRDPDMSRALYAIAGERGGAEQVGRLAGKVTAAISGMLATAPEVRFDDTRMIAAMTFSVLTGPVRALLEGNVPEGFAAQLEGRLVALLTAYLQTCATDARRRT